MYDQFRFLSLGQFPINTALMSLGTVVVVVDSPQAPEDAHVMESVLVYRTNLGSALDKTLHGRGENCTLMIGLARSRPHPDSFLMELKQSKKWE